MGSDYLDEICNEKATLGGKIIMVGRQFILVAVSHCLLSFSDPRHAKCIKVNHN